MFEGYLAILNETLPVGQKSISFIRGVYIILCVWRLSHGTDKLCFTTFFWREAIESNVHNVVSLSEFLSG